MRRISTGCVKKNKSSGPKNKWVVKLKDETKIPGAWKMIFLICAVTWNGEDPIYIRAIWQIKTQWIWEVPSHYFYRGKRLQTLNI